MCEQYLAFDFTIEILLNKKTNKDIKRRYIQMVFQLSIINNTSAKLSK